MRWSWKVGEVAGIGIYVHATFVLLLGWIALAQLAAGHEAAQTLLAVAFTVTLFFVIVLHELGHALTAKAFGIMTRDITLLPIGGVARLERIPENPWQELLVALAGPAVNVALAAVLWGALRLLDQPVFPGEDPATTGFAVKLLWSNVVLAVFNLLPAFPMDGGRVLRALLATSLEYTRATQLAANVGQLMAIGFGFLGVATNPMLLLVALFVWVGAAEESSLVHMRAAMRGIPVSRAMATRFQTLSPDEPLGAAVNHFLDGFQHDFPVVDEGRVQGVLRHVDLIRGLGQLGPEGRVKDVMQVSFETADDRDLLATAVAKLERCECRTLPVLRGGRLVGVLTPENVGELFMVQAALRERGSRLPVEAAA